MDFVKQCHLFIKEKKLFSSQHSILLAVSGGVDSMVLLYVLKNLRFTISVAHCNFQLRGEESNRDEAFVKQMANYYEVPFFCKRFDTLTYAKEHKENIQVAARSLRYNWFKELVNPITGRTFDFIATAHHQNDVAETVLHHFFKGTGIAGLHGISVKQHNIVRPLLFATKNSVLHFAQENNIEYITDSSNEKNVYTRNFLRNEIIPLLEKKYTTLQQNIIQNTERLSEVEWLYNEMIEKKLSKLLVDKNKEKGIPILLLKKEKASKTILWEIIKQFNFNPSQLDDVLQLINADNSKWVSSETHRIIKNRNWLLISTLKAAQSTAIIVEQNDTEIAFELGTLQFETKILTGIDHTPTMAFINSSKIKFPLLLRPWKEGDYFYPLGMTKKKKLARFFIDLKLSKTDKEKVWVLESDKKIIWVIGYRIDDRVKINNTNQPGLQILLR